MRSVHRLVTLALLGLPGTVHAETGETPAKETTAPAATPPPKPEAPKPEAPKPEAPKPRPPEARTQKPAAPEPSKTANDEPAEKEPAAPPGPLPPLNPMFRAALAVDTVWNTDPGYDLFSSDDLAESIGLRAELDALPFSDAAMLGLQLGVSSEQSENGPTVFSSSTPSLEAMNLFAGVLPRYQLLPILGVHAHAFGGATFTTVKMTINDRPFQQDSLNPFVAVGAGLSVSTPSWRTSRTRTHWNSMAIGAQVEGGYWLSPALQLAPKDVVANPPEQRLPVDNASLGTLDRGGPYVTVSAFVRL